MDAAGSDNPPIPDERATLTAYLEAQRQVLAWKCRGLSDAQLKTRAVPPSRLSLLGLVRHMAEVERFWFRRGLMAEKIGSLWNSPENRRAAFEEIEDADVAAAFAAWEEECQRARAILRDLPSLEEGFMDAHGWPCSARDMVNHMIEEYSRHNGHADLLRECLDGATGDFPPPEE
ncbi:MAG: DinB family protein, partial [Candidatus Dormibacteria bacterium]